MSKAEETVLYERQGAYIPRIAAIHDLCGYGKCSLGVAIPVLSAAGCDVCPVPTGLFSSHTAFPGWYMHDTTDILNDYLDAWKGIGVDIDAVCHCTLLDVLKMRSRAAEAAHACVHQNLDGVRVRLNDLDDAHIFCNCHDNLLYDEAN